MTTVRPELKGILIEICKRHNVAPADVMSRDKHSSVARVRQQYCLIGSIFGYSLTEIGQVINRNHTTALHNKQKAMDHYQTEGIYRIEVRNLLSCFPGFKDGLLEAIEQINIQEC